MATPEEIAAACARLRQGFDRGLTRPLAWRLEQLKTLEHILVVHEDELLAALWTDLGKPRPEALAGEILFTRRELRYALKHLKKWSTPQKSSTPLFLKPGRARWRWEPRGLCLLIGPWNYPVQLLLSPLVSCLAAGNCALLKPSEYATRTEQTLARLLGGHFSADTTQVICGDSDTSRHLLQNRFDYVFFTGSSGVGQAVYKQAAETLTPVTLELGGKCPAYVHHDADLSVAARRIVMGKFMNCGQTCVAPDYLLVHRNCHAQLLDLLSREIVAQYGRDVQSSPDYGRIVNSRHFDRLVNLMAGGSIAHGGRNNRDSLFIEPTLLENIPEDSPLLGEEIFGPLLPVRPVEGQEEALALIKNHPAPLALYLFSRSDVIPRWLAERLASGAVIHNECVLHLGVNDLPFGGTGNSGMGRYHGAWGFQAFSQARSYFSRATWLDPSKRYPPYSSRAEGFLRWLLG